MKANDERNALYTNVGEKSLHVGICEHMIGYKINGFQRLATEKLFIVLLEVE